MAFVIKNSNADDDNDACFYVQKLNICTQRNYIILACAYKGEYTCIPNALHIIIIIITIDRVRSFFV